MDTPETVTTAAQRVSVSVDAINAALDYLGAQPFKEVAAILSTLQATAKAEDGSDIERARQDGYDKGYGDGSNDGRREASPNMYYFVDDDTVCFTTDRGRAERWANCGVVLEDGDVYVG